MLILDDLELEDVGILDPLRARYNAQHFNLRKFYYECSNLKYLTGLINVPKLGQEPPNLMESGEPTPSLPQRPKNNAPPARKETPSSGEPTASADEIEEQRRMLEQYERKQSALVQQRENEKRKQEEEKARQEREFAEQQRAQAERERQAQEQLMRDQMANQYNQQQNSQAAEMAQQMEREMLAMRGQYERDQMLLEQYDRVSGFVLGVIQYAASLIN
jgi:type IV secretory pathway VirB10-like protein